MTPKFKDKLPTAKCCLGEGVVGGVLGLWKLVHQADHCGQVQGVADEDQLILHDGKEAAVDSDSTDKSLDINEIFKINNN